MSIRKKPKAYRRKDLEKGLVHSGVGSVTHNSQAEAILGNLIEQIALALVSGQSVVLPGLFTLEPKLRLARECSNPQTGERILVPPKVTVKCSISAALHERLQLYLDQFIVQYETRNNPGKSKRASFNLQPVTSTTFSAAIQLTSEVDED